ncbi:MAG: DUF502 domain-containing protein [Bdellovibrio sp.]|nr:DUF502 domain-containing protein [Bdellovibrio sp.]
MKKIHFVKDHFFAGMLVVIPLGVIAWILMTLWQSLVLLQLIFPESLQPENFFGNGPVSYGIRVLATLGLCVVALITVSLLGWASKQYLGGKILEWVGEIIQRIPVIRSVYSSLDQLLRALAAGGGQQFSRVVYVEYPRKGMWTLAFVTGSANSSPLGERHLNIYVPTTPNPTSGFYLLVPESEVRDANMRVEEAFKVILSLGIAQPAGSAGDMATRSH